MGWWRKTTDGLVEVGRGKGCISGGGSVEENWWVDEGGSGEEEWWIDGVKVGRWRKMDGLVDDNLPKLPSSVVGLACTTAGLWVRDDNLSFTNRAVDHGWWSGLHRQSISPSFLVWLMSNESESEEKKNFKRSANGLKVKSMCKIFYMSGWVILRSNTLIFGLTLFSWVAKHHHWCKMFSNFPLHPKQTQP